MQSVEYVETTVGQARSFFDLIPQRGQAITGDVSAWAFVASGRFQWFCMGCGEHYSPIYTTHVVVIPRDGQQPLLGEGMQKYDLTQLGTVHMVPDDTIKRLCGGHPARDGPGWYCLR